MFATIYDRHGERQSQYKLKHTEKLDCDIYAQRFADQMGIELDIPNTFAVPDGCEDYRVELAETPGQVVVWSSKNYMVVSCG